MVISGSLGGVLLSTLAWNARDVGSIPGLGTVFPIFITPTTLVAMTMDPVQATCCMVVEPTPSMYMYGQCLYVCNCRHYKTFNPRRPSVVVVCTDLLGKELHRYVGLGTVVTSGSLGCVMYFPFSSQPRQLHSPMVLSFGPFFLRRIY